MRIKRFFESNSYVKDVGYFKDFFSELIDDGWSIKTELMGYARADKDGDFDVSSFPKHGSRAKYQIMFTYTREEGYDHNFSLAKLEMEANAHVKALHGAKSLEGEGGIVYSFHYSDSSDYVRMTLTYIDPEEVPSEDVPDEDSSEFMEFIKSIFVGNYKFRNIVKISEEGGKIKLTCNINYPQAEKIKRMSKGVESYVGNKWIRYKFDLEVVSNKHKNYIFLISNPKKLDRSFKCDFP